MCHAALTCYDVLYAIFEHFDTLEETWYDYDWATQESHAWHIRQASVEGRRTLALCARVCRAFFNPAVALLWRNVDDLSRVFDLLRSAPLSSTKPAIGSVDLDEQEVDLSCLSHVMSAHNPLQLVRLRCLHPQAVRALQYTRRVRGIHGSRKPSRSRDDSCRPPSWESVRLLFPQLRYLRWTPGASGVEDLAQLVPPSLHSLHIVVPKTSQRGKSLTSLSLSEVLTKAPLLRYLRVSASDGVEGPWVDSFPHLAALETLDVLEFPFRDVSRSPSLIPLSALRHLRHLKFCLPESMSAVGLDAFPSLQTLTLDATCTSILTTTAFLSTITSPQLKAFTLLNCQCVSTSTNAELHELAAVLRARFSASLRQLDLSMRGASHPLVSDTQPLLEIMAPILGMHALTSVRILVSSEVSALTASKDDLRKAAEAWRKATRLHLCYRGPVPALRDLAQVKRRCPRLTDLVVPGIDASASESESEPESEPGPREDLPAHGLQFLTLHDDGCDSDIPDASRLARCLDALFPHVEWRCPSGGANAAWRETVEELVQLRIARLQRGRSAFLSF
ncbi:hypothetical protein BN946_scf184857.g42 [Trametes cinnabarina]|uniref:F-box domain-containing protein n=1 Tax=Pycnoporus cinnabarinus TaxID=5643 RepID=A0A060SSU0_PYCCI|nr:hypothetical protein BN946_scf184857.g42 [Trametes cinnabarina]